MSVACICPECDAKIFKAGGLLLRLPLRLRLSFLLDVEKIKKNEEKKKTDYTAIKIHTWEGF